VLVTERGVEAPPLNPHGFGEVLDRSSFKPLCPKDLDRTIQCLFPIELPWSAHSGSIVFLD